MTVEAGALLSAAELEGISSAADWSLFGEGRPIIARSPELDFRSGWPNYLEQLAETGIREIAITAEWAQLEPTPGDHHQDEVEFRRQLLQGARDLGLSPWLCLVDGTLPGWFSYDEGGFSRDRSRELVWPRHVEWIGETFGDLVEGWIPVREPVLTALRGYRYATSPPGLASETKAAEAIRSAVLAGGEAWRVLAGSSPVATYQTGRIVHSIGDNVRSKPKADWLDDVLWGSWTRALSSGVVSVPGLPDREAPILRDAFDRVIVELRPSVRVDADGNWTPMPAEREASDRSEVAQRFASEVGERELILATDLNPFSYPDPEHDELMGQMRDLAHESDATGLWLTGSPNEPPVLGAA